jgi:hypothetical protein
MLTALRLFKHYRRCGLPLGYSIRRALKKGFAR